MVKSRTIASRRQIAASPAEIGTPSGPPPATSPASRPRAACPDASTAPVTRSRASSRARATRSRPIRPAAPQTTTARGAAPPSDKLVLAEHLLELRTCGRAHARERKAELLGAAAHHGEGRLHRKGIHLETRRLHQREKTA